MIGFFDLNVDTTAKRTGIRDAFVVEHYKWMVNNSYYEFLVSILSGLLVDRFYDIWSLVLCRLSDTGLCRNSRQSHWPNTTTLSTSSAFIGIRSYTSIQPSLGAQFHTSCIFYKFPVRYDLDHPKVTNPKWDSFCRNSSLAKHHYTIFTSSAFIGIKPYSILQP